MQCYVYLETKVKLEVELQGFASSLIEGDWDRPLLTGRHVNDVSSGFESRGS